jgi:hypothetical protein
MPLPNNAETHFAHLKTLYETATDEGASLDARQKAAMAGAWAADQITMGMRITTQALNAVIAPKTVIADSANIRDLTVKGTVETEAIGSARIGDLKG